MKISLNIIKSLTRVDLPIDKLVDIIGSKLGAIDQVTKLGENYSGAVVVRVVKVKKHPNADKLSICFVDDGGVTEGIKRNKDGLIQIICGANNVKPEMLTVWIRPGYIIPNTASKDPVILTSKELRGVVSHGMLASGFELSINDDHSGIIELTDGKVGQHFAPLLELNDYIIDIENKMLTHRPDCFGHIGIAREIAGICGIQFKSPEWYLKQISKKLGSKPGELIIDNQIPKLVPRFLAQVIDGLNIKSSDLKTQSYLSRLGVRPINNVVDLTNYYMLLTAQPFHAYDYDKLKDLEPGLKIPKLVIRNAKPKETLKFLNGKTIELSPRSIVIASKSKAIGLGGVMGGHDTEVDFSTKRIILECANFNMYAIRRSSMDNGIFSEAVTRFNKGQSYFQNDYVLPKLSQSICELTGGVESSELDYKKSKFMPETISVSRDFINNLLGLELKLEEMAKILGNVEIGVLIKQNNLVITPPYWRTDLQIPEDVVEEIGRLFGYDKLKLVLPSRSISPVPKDALLSIKLKLSQLLISAGCNQTVNYAFVHGNLLKKLGQSEELAIKISNALSPDIEFYRMSIVSSLLDKVYPNFKAGFNQFALFELNKVVMKHHIENGLPKEHNHLGLVIVDQNKQTNKFAPYYLAYTYLEYILLSLGINFEIKPFNDQLTDKLHNQISRQFEPARAGMIYCGNKLIGVIGEPSVAVRNNLKLPNGVSMCELDIDQLLKFTRTNQYIKLSNYPKIDQDICFRLPTAIKYFDLYNSVFEVVKNSDPDIYFSLKPIDIFQGEKKLVKQITLRLTINSYTKTLKSNDLRQLLKDLSNLAKYKFKGEII
ncbi:MAG TPA: phenylalanine--tRNA ligase subunit beta [Candidatus Saccharimonadia bacterium]|nr:phenylalanine--tRNA ligase subunit beta [Candidatus Saccharimonadia bacterium]